MIVIGITGGVGSGKSALLRYMKEHYSCRILMADEAAHEVSRRGGSAYPALTALLQTCDGDHPILAEDGEIDRREMSSRIFTHPALREKVNAIVHPAVQEFVESQIRQERQKEEQADAQTVRYFILEAALLIECGYGAIVDEMWYIYCDPAIRMQRLKDARGYSEEKIGSIMAAQLTDGQYRAGSDVVIDNSGAPEETFRAVDAQFARLEEQSARAGSIDFVRQGERMARRGV